MNLNRVGNWLYDDPQSKGKRINSFLSNTNLILGSLPSSSFSTPFRTTYEKFLGDYGQLNKQIESADIDNQYWGEKAMTWGTVLTHRSKLI